MAEENERLCTLCEAAPAEPGYDLCAQCLEEEGDEDEVP
jgi:hypothetical protein